MLTISAHDVTYLVQLFLYHTGVGLEIIAALNRCCSKSTAAVAMTLKWIPGYVVSRCERNKIITFSGQSQEIRVLWRLLFWFIIKRSPQPSDDNYLKYSIPNKTYILILRVLFQLHRLQSIHFRFVWNGISFHSAVVWHINIAFEWL